MAGSEFTLLRVKIGVMGGSATELAEPERPGLVRLAKELAGAIAETGCVLVTGGTSGIPRIVSTEVRRLGGLTIGVSPAANLAEHLERYKLPAVGVDVLIFTGFGLKGRNVVNVRSSDIVVIFGGGMGTLNEFTIAYDEGRVIGVLEESGGVSEVVRKVLAYARKGTGAEVLFHSEPRELVRMCLDAYYTNRKEGLTGR